MEMPRALRERRARLFKDPVLSQVTALPARRVISNPVNVHLAPRRNGCAHCAQKARTVADHKRETEKLRQRHSSIAYCQRGQKAIS